MSIIWIGILIKKWRWVPNIWLLVALGGYMLFWFLKAKTFLIQSLNEKYNCIMPSNIKVANSI